MTVNFRGQEIITTGIVIPQSAQTAGKAQSKQVQSFKDVLASELAKTKEITFSAHSLKRMEDRNISLSEQQLGEIKEAVSRAESKGIRESLVVLDDVAFIVNIPNRTVITALDGKSMKENVFTNIDGAVFI